MSHLASMSSAPSADHVLVTPAPDTALAPMFREHQVISSLTPLLQTYLMPISPGGIAPEGYYFHFDERAFQGDLFEKIMSHVFEWVAIQPDSDEHLQYVFSTLDGLIDRSLSFNRINEQLKTRVRAEFHARLSRPRDIRLLSQVPAADQMLVDIELSRKACTRLLRNLLPSLRARPGSGVLVN